MLKSLRAAGNSTPVLILTAVGETLDRVEGLRAGADDYLPKPFALSELEARLEAIARRPAGEAATTTTLDIAGRSEEHTSELQSLMRSSYDVFCWKKITDVLYFQDSCTRSY